MTFPVIWYCARTVLPMDGTFSIPSFVAASESMVVSRGLIGRIARNPYVPNPLGNSSRLASAFLRLNAAVLNLPESFENHVAAELLRSLYTVGGNFGSLASLQASAKAILARSARQEYAMADRIVCARLADRIVAENRRPRAATNVNEADSTISGYTAIQMALAYSMESRWSRMRDARITNRLLAGMESRWVQQAGHRLRWVLSHAPHDMTLTT